MCGFYAADLCLCFRIYAKIRFSHDTAKMNAVTPQGSHLLPKHLLKLENDSLNPIWQLSISNKSIFEYKNIYVNLRGVFQK